MNPPTVKTFLTSFRWSSVIIILICCCHGEPSVEVTHVPRDTTITAENSYTKKFIDSAFVEAFLTTENISDTTAQRVRNFYNKRNYSYAWFTDSSSTVQAQAFWSLHDDHLRASGDSSVYHGRLHTVMDTIMKSDSFAISPDTLAVTELRLTAHFLLFMKTAFGPKANPEEFQWYIPVRRLKIDALLDSLLSNEKKEWRPLNKHFHNLQRAILLHNKILQKGGWDSIQQVRRPLKLSDRHVIITGVKKRLILLNQFPKSDTSEIYNDTLASQIEKVRLSLALPGAPIIDSSLINELNVPVDVRLRQMLINLERFKWVPDEPEKYIFVNIPDFSLSISDNGRQVLKMRVVVGKTATRTVVFSGDLKYVVFSPYWNIPASIVKSEILPGMSKSTSYLTRNDMEIVGYSAGLPVVRQRPGPRNALGKVKFLFPNEYNIYLHDTNARNLFERSDRAFSHGCIRVERPFELARHLLHDDSSWNQEKIKKAMNANEEKWVTLNNPIRVFIVYITSWVDNSGFVNFRKDIYSHDKKMSESLFEKDNS